MVGQKEAQQAQVK